MSTRSSRKRARVSYNEDIADESDAFEDPGEEEDDDEWDNSSNKKKKQRTTQGKGRKGKKGKQESDSDSTSEGEDDSDSGEEDDDAEIEEEGVDFSQDMPYEIVAEIFSYLTPRELLIFNNSSKSFNSILAGASSRSLWVKARKNLRIPDVDFGDVTEQQLATLLFNRECESCGVGQVSKPDLSLRKRLCFDCREANWVKLTDVEKLYPDFHAATSQAVRTTRFAPQRDRYRMSAQYALYEDLRTVNEHLEHLELLDAANQPLSDEEDDEEDDEGGGGAGSSSVSTTRSGRRTTRTKVNYAVEEISHKERSKKLKTANRLKRSWRPAARQRGARLDAEVADSFSPRVNEYLKKQKERNQEWEKIASDLTSVLDPCDTILKNQEAASEIAVSTAAQLRRSSIEDKLAKRGFKRWSFDDDAWKKNDLVYAPKSLTDEEWRKIKKRLRRIAGQSIANQLWKKGLVNANNALEKKKQTKLVESAKKKHAQLEAGQEEAGDEIVDLSESEEEEIETDSEEWKMKVLEKPKKVSVKVWKYVFPHLEKLASGEMDLDEFSTSTSKSRKKNKPKVNDKRKNAKTVSKEPDPLSVLTWEQRKTKLDFFAEKYDKIVDLQPSPAEQFALPLFSRFLHLPSVKALFRDNPLFAAQSNVKKEKEKADKVWEKKFEEVIEDVGQYAVDTVAHVVETVLSVTSDASKEDLSKIDIIHLLSDSEMEKETHLIDDNFFTRPSSFVICGICRHVLGPFDSILKHQHEVHNGRQDSLSSTPSHADLFPLELSFEASCAVAAVLEVADISGDQDVSSGTIKKALGDRMLVWDNQPKSVYGKKFLKAEEWKELVCRVHGAALVEEQNGKMLAIPTFILRDKTARERRREMYASTYAQFRRRW